MASAQGQAVSDIAHMFTTTQGYMRKVIHEFNDQGFGGLDSKCSSGPAVRITETIRERICRIARCHPQDLGRLFTVWSVSKLVDYLVEQHVVDLISKETLRQIVKRHGMTWQATTTWKASHVPDFRPKMETI